MQFKMHWIHMQYFNLKTLDDLELYFASMFHVGELGSLYNSYGIKIP